MAAPRGIRWCYSKWYSYNFYTICPTGRLKSRSICTWPASGLPGLQPEETAPDHSTLSRFRSRLGSGKFQEIFNEIIRRAREAGLVNDRLRSIDATHLQAKADLFRLPQPPPGIPLAELPGSPDPDARFGRKSEKKSFYGYKEHIAIDADSELITAVEVTPGNVADSEEFIGLVDPHTREVTAERGYDTNANHQKLKERGQRSSIIVKKNRIDPQIISQADPKSQRERPNIERKFVEQKKSHGLGMARYWGLAKVTIQVLLTCIVVNCKRLVKLLSRVTKLPQGALCPADAGGWLKLHK